MDITKINETLQQHHGLHKSIGMTLVSTPEADTCMARMAVDERTMQPFGYLSGGATLALAETLAGAGSCSVCPNMACMGMNVQCNHVHAAAVGDTVTALARLIHKGKTTHVWRIDVTNQAGMLISTVNVTNYIAPLPSCR